VLAEVLKIGCLLDESIHLSEHIELLMGLEVATSQLLLDPGENLQCASVLYLLGFGLVRRRDARTVTIAY
jgi:hypothetical protein